MANPKLVYFPARGRAEVIRLILAEAGVQYDDVVVTSPAEFVKPEVSARLPFMAVPVWEEDGFRLAQSTAIANHIARANGLYGKTPREAALIDQAWGAVEDVRQEFRKLVAAPPEKRPAVRADMLATILPKWFGWLEKLLASNRDGAGFLVGENPSHADFSLWYLIEIAVDNGFGAALEKTPKLRAFSERIAARPRIASYLGSKRRPALSKLPG